MSRKPKDKSIRMDESGVRAILQNQKSQTRRVMKPQMLHDDGMAITQDGHGQFAQWFQMGSFYRCQYKQGDRVWVKEPFAFLSDLRTKDPGTGALGDRAFFRADHPTGLFHDDNPIDALHWRSPTQMPRELARIFIEITDVRPERVQSITLQDALAEGVEVACYEDLKETYITPVMAFAKYWDLFNAQAGFAWKRNPWAWVISFERV